MQVTLWPIDRVIPYDRNPRQNDQAVDAVAASLKAFGFRQPIVVDNDGVIVVGHTRWKAAKKLGLAKVPVHIAKDLTPEQAKAYRLADNQTATIAEWDKELLPLELADLNEANFDLGLLGFSEDELAKWLQPVQEGLCDPDDVPAPPDEATTRPGELILLGDHRLLCGDSSKPEDVDPLLDGATIHLVNTDPPYNVKVEPQSNSGGLSMTLALVFRVEAERLGLVQVGEPDALPRGAIERKPRRRRLGPVGVFPAGHAHRRPIGLDLER